MTIIEVEMRVRERQQQMLKEAEHQHLLRSLFPHRSLRAQLAAALFWLGENSIRTVRRSRRIRR